MQRSSSLNRNLLHNFEYDLHDSHIWHQNAFLISNFAPAGARLPTCDSIFSLSLTTPPAIHFITTWMPCYYSIILTFGGQYT